MTSITKITTLITTAIITLTACESSVQTSSGKDFGQNIPFGNREISKASKVEPILKFPAKFCMVKMARGYMQYMDDREVKIWQTIAARHLDWGEITQVSPIVINIVLSEGIGSNNGKATTQNVRLAAARQHCDAIMAFEYVGTSINAVLYDTKNGYTYITASQTGKNSDEAFANLSIEVEQAMGKLAQALH